MNSWPTGDRTTLSWERLVTAVVWLAVIIATVGLTRHELQRERTRPVQRAEVTGPVAANDPYPRAEPAGAQVQVVTPAVPATAALPAASPIAAAVAATPEDAADAVQRLHPGARVIRSIDVPGPRAGAPAGSGARAVVYGELSGVDGCAQPFIDVLRADGHSGLALAWSANGSGASGGALISQVRRDTGGCYPAVDRFDWVTPAAGRAAVALVVVALADGSRRIALLDAGGQGGTIGLVYDGRTGPAAAVTETGSDPLTLEVREELPPPPGAGLPAGVSVGQRTWTLSWATSGFAAQEVSVALNCTTGAVVNVSGIEPIWTVGVRCAGGKRYAAIDISGTTQLVGGFSASSLRPGDDVSFTIAPEQAIASVRASALPVAASVGSVAAALREGAVAATSRLLRPASRRSAR